MFEIIIGAVLTLVVTIIANFIMEYWKNRLPKIEYEIRNGIPIKIGEKRMNAYIVQVQNASSKTISDVTLLLNMGSATIYDNEVKVTQGVKFTKKEESSELEIKIEYIKKADQVAIIFYAEHQYHVPEPRFVIRSPENIKIVDLGTKSENKSSFSWLYKPAVVGVVVVATASSFVGDIFFSSVNGQKDTVMFIANAKNLPELAVAYSYQDNVAYYNQGDYIYAKVKLAKNQEEIMNYREFLVDVISHAVNMANVSKSHLWYSIGKIDLLINDKLHARESFKWAIDWNKRHVIKEMAYEPTVGKFINEEGLLK